MNVLMTSISDDGLVDRAKQGDLDAYSELVRRHRERLYRTIFRFTRDHGDTDDLAQETFLQAYREIDRFRENSGFYTWLYRIAVNLSLNFLKRKKREMGRREFDERSVADRQAPGFSPEAVSLSRELHDRVNDAVDSLPLPYKTSFILVVYEGMSHGQAARVLGCSENTVSWRLHKARKMLQAKLRPVLGEVSG
jgi:RNA polymerase sigma-70 factor (ECF subfamily)